MKTYRSQTCSYPALLVEMVLLMRTKCVVGNIVNMCLLLSVLLLLLYKLTKVFLLGNLDSHSTACLVYQENSEEMGLEGWECSGGKSRILVQTPCVINFLLLCNWRREGTKHISGSEHGKIRRELVKRQPERQPDTLGVNARQSDSTKGCFTKHLLFQACVSFA